jgi:hypothetical protein
MFRVKHFGRIGAENLPGPHTPRDLKTVRNGAENWYYWPLDGAAAHQGEAAEGVFGRFFALLQGFGASIALPGACSDAILVHGAAWLQGYRRESRLPFLAPLVIVCFAAPPISMSYFRGFQIRPPSHIK